MQSYKNALLVSDTAADFATARAAINVVAG